MMDEIKWFRGRKWSVEEYDEPGYVREVTITGAQALELLRVLPDERAALKVVGARMRSSRIFDRPIQVLRKRGLVRYVRASRAWERTQAGEELVDALMLAEKAEHEA